MNTRSSSIYNYIDIGFITILFADLFLKVLPIIPFYMFIMSYVALRCNFYEKVFMLFIYFPMALGFVLNSLGYSGIGGFPIILGFVMGIYGVLVGKAKINNPYQAIVSMLLLLMLFSVSVLSTEGGSYASTKLSSTTIAGIRTLSGFVFFFSNYKNVNTQKVGIFFILLSILFLRIAIYLYHMPGPLTLIDFNFFRVQHVEFSNEDEQMMLIGYQIVGFLCAQGIGYYFLSVKKHVINKSVITIMLLSTLVVLYSGSRQAIITVLFIFSLVALQQRGRGISNRVIIPFAILSFVVYMFISFTSETGILYSVLQEGYIDGSGRGAWLMSGIEQFTENPFWGVGFGRYFIFGHYGSYPHNLFVELLCETGLIGFTFAMFLISRRMIRNRSAFQAILFLFVAMFFRFMASAGLNSSIMLFSLVFALPALKNVQSPKIESINS